MGPDLTLTTEDGVRIAATLYEPKAESPPGLILLHELGADRSAWTPFAVQARREGYMSIAIDMRGHGASQEQDGAPLDYRDFERSDWMGVLNDMAAAKEALLEAGADPDDLGAAGASIGANLALHYAAQDRDIQAVVLMSPGLEYKGVGVEEALADYGNRPALLVVSEGDSYSAESVTAMEGLAQGQVQVERYDGGAHGTGVFDRHTRAKGQVLEWLEPILKPAENPQTAP
jgi:dienelactone hydrolase